MPRMQLSDWREHW